MESKDALNKELKEWRQEKVQQGKFPCKRCHHFESLHIKRMCIACHDDEIDHHDFKHSCYHSYEKMDNLSLIEWFAQNKESQNGNV